jgi:hypothetical protein
LCILTPVSLIDEEYAMKTVIILMTALCIPVLAFTATLHVPSVYPTIQIAIDVAADGDTVLVAPGTYMENIRFHGKSITVISSESAEVTVIDGGQKDATVRFQDGESMDAVLQGFTITNGSGDEYFKFFAPPLGGYYVIRGGGIYCFEASPTIRHNRIVDNEAFCPRPPGTHKGNMGLGAGIYVEKGGPVIKYNLIADNRFTGVYHHNDGGGILCSNASPRIIGNIIKGHETMFHGGGICVGFYSDPLILNNVIAENTAGSYGGGIFILDVGTTVSNNLICDNTAVTNGGGICVTQEPEAMIEGNIICGNQALEGRGGGVLCRKGVLRGNLVYDNSSFEAGGGLYIETATVTNNTVVNNTTSGDGGGICAKYVYNPNHGPYFVESWNNIFWGNSAQTGIEAYVGDQTTLEFNSSDVMGGQALVYVESGGVLDWKAGMIDTDPLFVDAAANDFHLTYLSPCRDAGDPDAPRKGDHDFEGDPRIALETVDMGADEFFTHLYCTGDFTPGGSMVGKLVGLPGTSPVGLFLGSGVLDPPANTMWGKFYLMSPWMLLPLAPIPADGVLELPSMLPATPPAPYDLPMQALIGLEPDSLTNVFVLEVR